jgi:integrase/recombinase XerD
LTLFPPKQSASGEEAIMSKPTPSRVRVSGPLEAYADGFRKELATQGYSSSPAAGHLQLMAHLSRWLADRDLDPGELTVAWVKQFVEDRRAAGRVHRRLTLRGVSPLLGFLRGLGVVPLPAPPAPRGVRERLLEEFAEYLACERGLAASTVRNYGGVAEAFLSACSSGADQAGWVVGDLTAGDVTGFVLSASVRHSAGSLNNVTTGLRALLRFLHAQGHTATSLVGAVPTAPGWRDGGLPRAAAPDEVRRLLASCDRRTTVGRRDFAILTVLTRLGLRAGEVAALTLDDIDWRVSEILVTGKGGRREPLPLPADVGQAIADYCWRGRRRASCRGLFLRTNAPYTALSASGISEAVARACARAGLKRLGPHRLRHAAATAMRRAGAPLLEIGQVLRHRRVASTAHYARDDRDALTAVARPWLGGVSCLCLG